VVKSVIDSGVIHIVSAIASDQQDSIDPFMKTGAGSQPCCRLGLDPRFSGSLKEIYRRAIQDRVVASFDADGSPCRG